MALDSLIWYRHIWWGPWHQLLMLCPTNHNNTTFVMSQIRDNSDSPCAGLCLVQISTKHNFDQSKIFWGTGRNVCSCTVVIHRNLLNARFSLSCWSACVQKILFLSNVLFIMWKSEDRLYIQIHQLISTWFTSDAGLNNTKIVVKC